MPLKPVTVTLSGKRVFADMIKYLKTISPWNTIGPKSNDKCPCKKQKKKRHGHRGEGHVKMEAKTRVMQPQAKKCPEPPDARRGTGFFSGDFKGSTAL